MLLVDDLNKIKYALNAAGYLYDGCYLDDTIIDCLTDLKKFAEEVGVDFDECLFCSKDEHNDEKDFH